MNKRVKLLDCTLRDGGFVNDWKFGHATMNSIFNRINSSGIDIIELGFIDARRNFDINRTIQPDTASFKKIFNWHEKVNAICVAMIDFGTCPIENIENCNDSILDGIRVIFKKKDIAEALDFCQQIKEKGYKLFVQPVSITTYTDKEMLELIEQVNEIEPYTFSIVDTYGLMHREKLFKYFYLIDNNLNAKTCIGFHSHNNFQLAYSNSIELLSIETTREIVLDGSCYGMGKGAGNANIELLALFVKENCKKEYDLNYILEAIDTNIMPIYQKEPWGYSLDYFLAASNSCHPKYVKYLINKHTLSVKSTNEILEKITIEKKLTFDEDLIKDFYYTYQKQVIDDSASMQKFKKQIENREILLIAPGKNLGVQYAKVRAFIEEKTPVIISVNFLSHKPKSDFVFVSNSKRYMQLADRSDEILGQKIMLTSNIIENNVNADFMFNYSSLMNKECKVADTSMLMLLKLLENASVERVYIAGFDGFAENGELNYADSEMMFESDFKPFKEINEAITSALKNVNMDVCFVTSSIYDTETENV